MDRFPEDETPYGEANAVSPLVRRVLARNPSPFTFTGTGTYIIGHGTVAVIDPGPNDPSHIDALTSAVQGETVRHILVTHTHLDHSPASKPFAKATGAPILAYGPHGTGRSGGLAGQEVEAGADWDFSPDQRLEDGQTISGPGWTVEAIHTPGHTSNHLCYALREEAALFSGDHVMGWSTTIVSPPDGDMGAYMASLEKIMQRSEEIIWPTHGPPITKPRQFVRSLLGHRKQRERQILSCLEKGVHTIPEMVLEMYRNVSKSLHSAAARSVLAHLIHMAERDLVSCDGSPREDSYFDLGEKR